MTNWAWFGLSQGRLTTGWPEETVGHGQEGVLGMPRLHPERCAPTCRDCISACPSGAITGGLGESVTLDYGRCVVCQRCTEVCPTGAIEKTTDWAFGVRTREALLAGGGGMGSGNAESPPSTHVPRGFRRSLHIRHVDAGSCNGCESELEALLNPFYNLHRLGIFFTASPRSADLLLVTGPVTVAMKEPLLETYRAMPEPRFVMAMGTCATGGGIAGGGYSCHQGLEGILPVDLWLPGCPPNPAALMEALLVLLGRRPERGALPERAG
jgi:Ni,Fe-hydrogenase III small subunit/Pyruvate/2-oxoacid:ferredoxin oxidoreductase delta subunit